MRKPIFAAMALLALSGTACSYITSAQPSVANVSGEAWYVKSTYLLGLSISASVYHCPKDTPTQCTKAQMQ